MNEVSLAHEVLVTSEGQGIAWAAAEINLVFCFDGEPLHTFKRPKHKMKARPCRSIIGTQPEHQAVFIRFDGVGAHIEPSHRCHQRQDQPSAPTGTAAGRPPPRKICSNRSWLLRITSSRSGGWLLPPRPGPPEGSCPHGPWLMEIP
jgi:hypothetical protein